MTETTQSFWDRISKMSRPSTELGPTARKTVDAVRMYLSEESLVLDVGCGSGSLTMAIAQSVASVHAIDMSPGMIDVAKSRANQQGAGNVNFELGDLSAVASQREAFTTVTVFNVLHYVEDISEFSRQIGKLLAPGGVFLSSTACLGERSTFLGTLTWILMKLRIMPDTHFLKQAELVDLITGGGFQIMAMKKLSPLPEYFIAARKAT